MISRRVIAVVVVVMSLGVAVAAMAVNQGNNSDASGGNPAQPDVLQGVSAQSSGITVAIDSANFSGSATIVAIRITETQQLATPAARFQVPPTGFAAGSLAPFSGMDAFSAPAGKTALARLQPIAPGEPAVIRLNTIKVGRADGTTATVAGDWQLPLVQPADLAQRMHVEHLDGVGVSDAGIRVNIEGAVRSVTETVITVRVDSQKPASPIGQPYVVAGGTRLNGGLIASQEGGRLLTYSFPPTGFGKSLDVHFGPFSVSAESSVASAVVIDLGAVVERNKLTPAVKPASAAPEPGDVSSVSGSGLSIRTVQLWDGFNSTRFPGKHLNVEFTVEGIFPPDQATFTAFTQDGRELTEVLRGNGYNKDATGALVAPRTDVRFVYDSSRDIEGRVTLSVSGMPMETVRGEWRITLRPGP